MNYKTQCFIILFLLFLISSCNQLDTGETNNSSIIFKKFKLVYPYSFRDSTLVENYHGLNVADPYRWLEEENSDSTRKWIRSQNSLTNKYLDEIPYRGLIRERLKQLWNYERQGVPMKKGNYYYAFRNSGLQSQDQLYRMRNPNGNGKVVLDPNKLSKNGSSSLGFYSFSKDGTYLAYEVSRSGSDWRTILVKNMNTGEDLRDTIRWVKFSQIAWRGNGFFYSRYAALNRGDRLTASNEFHQVYYHRLGTDQEEDELIFADRSNPKRNFLPQTTSDERFLLLNIVESTSGNAVYFRDLRSGSYDFVPIVERFGNDFDLVGNIGEQLLFITNNRAANKRIIQVNANKPEPAYWEEIIKEEDDLLLEAHLLGDKIVTVYLKDAAAELKIYEQNGDFLKKIALPEIGMVKNLNGAVGESKAYFSFTSFTRPSTIFELDLERLQIVPMINPKIDFDGSRYVVKQVWYESYDETKIPMFIIHRRGLKLDKKRPTLLYGYGGFDIPMLPEFNRTRLNLFPVVLENGGVCAVANIRGGGEFGKKWHLAGTKKNKQNVFDDFQAAAEYLITSDYTSSDKLAIYGRSNGGLLVGACMTQRPDLYKVALPAVGVMDMLRYHKFTIGWAWASDYGVSNNSREFEYLFQYSPLHNTAPEDYPATLITTADHDDRVVPAHSFKFASALQRNQLGGDPILIRIDYSSGHGAGKSTNTKIEEGADILSFMFYNMQENVVYRTVN